MIRCEKTLHRWADLECGDGNDHASWAIERDPETEVPYMVTHFHRTGETRKKRIADRERGALKRAAAIAAEHGCQVYHQSDPRGCVLYLLRPGDIRDGSTPDQCYTNGIAICY